MYFKVNYPFKNFYKESNDSGIEEKEYCKGIWEDYKIIEFGNKIQIDLDDLMWLQFENIQDSLITR